MFTRQRVCLTLLTSSCVVLFRLPEVKSFVVPSSTRVQSTSRFQASTGADSPKTTAFIESSVLGPPPETKPDYQNIIGPLGRELDWLFLQVFRNKLEEQVKEAFHAEGKSLNTEPISKDYYGIIQLANLMNRNLKDRAAIQLRAQRVLQSLFPSWLPGSYAKLFSKPFPEFSSRMNAAATKYAGTWLMGECEINDVEFDDGTIGKSQGLLVKRCRFLEESGCASVCVNSCKIPTQNFFMQDMGLALTMEPDYDTFECQFSFGKMPTKDTEALAKSTPCLSRCPTVGALRKFHDGQKLSSKACELMEDKVKI